MIRFVDLSEIYWTDPEEHGGPVCAFLDTRTDRFVTAHGHQLFYDVEDIDDIEEAHLRERCRGHVPDGFWERKRRDDDAVEQCRRQLLGEMAVADVVDGLLEEEEA